MFLLLAKRDSFYVHAGEKTFTGTGRSMRSTLHVAPSDNYRGLPVSLGEIVNARGTEVAATGDPLMRDFYREFSGYLGYEAYLNDNGELCGWRSRN